MTGILDTRPVQIASAELEALSTTDLATFGLGFDRAAATLAAHGKPQAARLLSSVSDTLESEVKRRQSGDPAPSVAETTLGDVGAQLSRAEASRLMFVLDGLAGRGQIGDAAFLLDLSQAVERQLAHNLDAEQAVLRLLAE